MAKIFQAKFLVFYQMVPLDPAGRVSVSELTTSLEGAILTEGKSQAGTLLVTLCVGPTLTSLLHHIPTHTYEISYSPPPPSLHFPFFHPPPSHIFPFHLHLRAHLPILTLPLPPSYTHTHTHTHTHPSSAPGCSAFLQARDSFSTNTSAPRLP